MSDVFPKWTNWLSHQIIIGALLAGTAVAHARYPWGMSTDLNWCGGCSVCIPVRQSKSKKPIVGEEMVASTPGEGMNEQRVTPKADPHHLPDGVKIEGEH
jgi:hypothetical protein